MFSGMQQNEPLSICEQALAMAEAYRDFHSAWVNLAQLESKWNDEVSAYLREEEYLGGSGHELVSALVENNERLIKPLQKLAQDHETLCSDLLRVGRGESFSV